MTSAGNDNSTQTVAVSPWRSTAVATAIVGAAFVLISSGVLVANYVYHTTVAVQREERLTELREQVVAAQDTEKMLSQIRQLDLTIRAQRVRRVYISHGAGYLLLASTVVFLIGALWAAKYTKSLPSPGGPADRGAVQLRRAVWTRWSLAGGLAVLLAIGFVFAQHGMIEFAKPDAGGQTYPSAQQIAGNWHRFRGPGGAGVTTAADIPSHWDGKTGDGILWKSEVPLPGHNSPIVWDYRVFVSGATENQRQVYCFDAANGQLLWAGDVPSGAQSDPEFEIMESTGFAASTMATDGQRVYAIFVTGDLACFDFHGRRLWAKNLGFPDSAYGYATSLETFRNTLIVQYDQGAEEDAKSRLFAFDGPSGRLVWQVNRPVANSWTSPIIVDVNGTMQLITVADPWTISYDPQSGTEIWRAKCVSDDLAPSPIYAGGLIVAIAPYSHVVAVRPDGAGDVTETHIAWKAEEGAPDICSPVSDGKLVWTLATEGLLMWYNVVDGSLVGEIELDGGFFASPSLVGDKLYLLSEKGVMYIGQAGPQYKQLAKCELGEECQASPAFVQGRIYIRGFKNLYCIGASP